MRPEIVIPVEANDAADVPTANGKPGNWPSVVLCG